MKDEQITKLFSKWQTRLKLDHWDVELEIINDSELPFGGEGQVDFNLTYLTATIRLAKNHSGGIPRSKKKLTQAAIHELIHIHLAGLNTISGTRERTAEEQAVQILSRVIMEGYEGAHK